MNQCRNGHTRTAQNTTYRRGEDKPLCLDCERQRDKKRASQKWEKEKTKYEHDAEPKNYKRSPKLNWEKVREIRQKYKSGDYSSRDLAIEYKVSQPNIISVINNKTWKE